MRNQPINSVPTDSVQIEIFAPRISITEAGGVISAWIPGWEDIPVTSLSLVQRLGCVEEVHPFETGEYGEWTRYYHEKLPDSYPAPVSGVCYHFGANHMDFNLGEYFGADGLELHLEGRGLRQDPTAQQAAFADMLGRMFRTVHPDWHPVPQLKPRTLYHQSIFGNHETTP